MYESGGKVFQTMAEAVAYANFIAKISRVIVAVERIKEWSTYTNQILRTMFTIIFLTT